MTIRITFEAFSGQPDPEWLLSHEQAAEFGRLVATASQRGDERQALTPPGLGYRGFRADDLDRRRVIRVFGSDVAIETEEGVIRRHDSRRNLETFLLEVTAQRLRDNPGVAALVNELLQGKSDRHLE